MSEERLMLESQIDIVIYQLEERIKKEPERPILQTLYDRYTKAKQILLENEDISKIMIKGGCRAYLDSYSDYMNPLLMEMDRAEEMLQKIKNMV